MVYGSNHWVKEILGKSTSLKEDPRAKTLTVSVTGY